MTLFFNLYAIGWRRTRLLRVELPSLPRHVHFWQFFSALLLWAYGMLALAGVDLRNVMANELVEARREAAEWKADALCMMNGNCVLLFRDEGGKQHAVSVKNSFSVDGPL